MPIPPSGASRSIRVPDSTWDDAATKLLLQHADEYTGRGGAANMSALVNTLLEGFVSGQYRLPRTVAVYRTGRARRDQDPTAP